MRTSLHLVLASIVRPRRGVDLEPATCLVVLIIGPWSGAGSTTLLQKGRRCAATSDSSAIRYLFETHSPEINQASSSRTPTATPSTATCDRWSTRASKREARHAAVRHAARRLTRSRYEGRESLARAAARRPPTLFSITVGGPPVQQAVLGGIFNISGDELGRCRRTRSRAQGGAKLGGFEHDTGRRRASRPTTWDPVGDLIWEIAPVTSPPAPLEGQVLAESSKRNARARVDRCDDQAEQAPRHGTSASAGGEGDRRDRGRSARADGARRAVAPGEQRVLDADRQDAVPRACAARVSGGKTVGLKTVLEQAARVSGAVQGAERDRHHNEFVTIDETRVAPAPHTLEFSNLVGTPLREGLSSCTTALSASGCASR